MEDFRIDDLQLDGLKIKQKIGGYGFTSDSVLLANFVKAKKSDTLVEIGTGCGVISILVNYKEKPKKILAFEIQGNASILAEENVKLNNMHNVISVINEDVINFKNFIEEGSIDVVFSNPPYFKYDKNIESLSEEKLISRTEKCLKLEDFFKISSKMLKFGGKLYFVNSSERLTECFFTMKKYNISPKKIYFVHPNQSKNSSVFLCEGIKGGKDGTLVMPPLFTNNLDGDYVQTIQKLYKGK